MQTYTCIVRLCDEYDKAADLYLEYQQLLSNYMNNKIYTSIQSKVGDSKEFLAEYCQQWKNYTIFTFSMKKMFEYLDRYYLKNGAEKCQNLTETALNHFKEKIFKNRMVDLRRCIMQEIKKDRENEIVDQDLIKESINQFIYMGFEKKVIIKKLEDQ